MDPSAAAPLPRVALTMGDAAGVGPEIIARAWNDPRLYQVARPIVVGMPPGARHELGSLIFATAARRAGMPVIYLGADLPVQDWLAAVDQTRARAVVIGAVMSSDKAAATSVATALRAHDPQLVIAFGGGAAPDPGPASEGLTIHLPDDVRAAVAALRSAIGPGGAA